MYSTAFMAKFKICKYRYINRLVILLRMSWIIFQSQDWYMNNMLDQSS